MRNPADRERSAGPLAVLAIPVFIVALPGLRKILTAAFACVVLLPSTAWAGPPYLTDDPDPVEYGHLEVIPFYAVDRAADGTEIQGPGADISYGVAPDMHLNLVPVFVHGLPDGGPSEYGFGDFRVALKWRFVHETDERPVLAIYPAVVFPSGDARRGLGNGQVSYQFPVWLEKSWGSGWSSYGGGGWTLNRAPGQRDYLYGGWQVQKQVTDTWNLGLEIFAQGATAQGSAGYTTLNVGGGYKMTGSTSLIFTIGHSFAGASHALGFLGLVLEW